MPEGVIYVGRPTVYGNPFTVDACIEAGYASTKEAAREICVKSYCGWLVWDSRVAWRLGMMTCGDEMDMKRDKILDSLDYLRGKNLACWCPLTSCCHADVLIELANAT